MSYLELELRLGFMSMESLNNWRHEPRLHAPDDLRSDTKAHDAKRFLNYEHLYSTTGRYFGRHYRERIQRPLVKRRPRQAPPGQSPEGHRAVPQTFDDTRPDVAQVADPLHRVKLANQKLDECHRR